MPKRKLPITQQPPLGATGGREQKRLRVPSASISAAHTRRIIRSFHTLSKQLTRLDSDSPEAVALKTQLDSLGGIDAYQAASFTGQSAGRGGDTSRWLVDHLRRHMPSAPSAPKLRILDVGALTADNYAREAKWIHCDAVDLNPREARVRQADILTAPPPPDAATLGYDVVSLSLVVNFNTDAVQRGEMIRRSRLFLRPASSENALLPALFLVLPLPCVSNSRYCTHEHLLHIARACGYECVEWKHSARLAYYIFRLTAAQSASSRSFPKKEINPGRGRNNFCIVLNANA